MSKLFITVLLIVLIICTALAVMLYVSLVPYFGLVGKIAIVCLIILAACAMIFAIMFTFTHSLTMWHNMQHARQARDFVQMGEVVIWIKKNDFVHVSALHEAAKVPTLSPGIVDQDTPDELPAIAEKKEVNEQGILAFHEQGASERSIAAFYDIPRNQIRKVLKKHGKIETA